MENFPGGEKQNSRLVIFADCVELRFVIYCVSKGTRKGWEEEAIRDDAISGGRENEGGGAPNVW